LSKIVFGTHFVLQVFVVYQSNRSCLIADQMSCILIAKSGQSQCLMSESFEDGFYCDSGCSLWQIWNKIEEVVFL